MNRHDSMRLRNRGWAVVCLLLFLVSCGQKSKNNMQVVETVVGVSDSSRIIIPEYAEGFEVQYVEGGCLVTIQDPQKEKGKGEIYRYALVRDKEAFAKNKVSDDYVVRSVPVKNIICMTSLQLSNFIKLDELDHVVGITSTRHLFNKEVNRRLKEKKIRKIGIEGNFDNEIIISMNPDLILISPFKRGGYDA